MGWQGQAWAAATGKRAKWGPASGQYFICLTSIFSLSDLAAIKALLSPEQHTGDRGDLPRAGCRVTSSLPCPPAISMSSRFQEGLSVRKKILFTWPKRIDSDVHIDACDHTEILSLKEDGASAALDDYDRKIKWKADWVQQVADFMDENAGPLGGTMTGRSRAF